MTLHTFLNEIEEGTVTIDKINGCPNSRTFNNDFEDGSLNTENLHKWNVDNYHNHGRGRYSVDISYIG